jgi:DNA-binding FadR family transcriptional regulator
MEIRRVIAAWATRIAKMDLTPKAIRRIETVIAAMSFTIILSSKEKPHGFNILPRGSIVNSYFFLF